MLGARNASSIKGKYERLKKTYDSILAFEKFTGNGGGDGDLPLDLDDKDRVKDRIQAAARAGKNCENLSAKTLKEWHDKGWYALFNGRSVLAHLNRLETHHDN